MYPVRRVNDSVHWFMSSVTSRIVAESGIPSDVHHLGKILLQSLKDDPDFILQIDGGTGDSETNGSVLERTVRCAIALKQLGLQKGDVITLMAPNYLDLAIPFYAALYLGVIVSPIDRTLGINELRGSFDVTQPKVFCQNDQAQEVQLALNGIQSDAFIVVFDNCDGKGTCSFPEFLEKYGDKSLIEDFKPTDFDPEETIALLISTSGTTGLPKSAAASHKNLAISGPCGWNRYTQYPKPFKMIFIVSPLQWLTALLSYLMSPILRFTRLQTSKPLQQPHAYHLINTYKPSFIAGSPTYLTTLITPEANERLDLSCFETILMGGSAVTANLLQEIKKMAPNAEVLNCLGISEVTCLVFIDDGTNEGSATIGKPIGYLQYRISPVELEKTIRQHPAVLDVAVTGIPDKRGDLPVACVVRRPGQNVTAEEITQLVKENLADTKQLRGGVIFLDSIPLAPSTKIDRRKIKEIALRTTANQKV